MSVLEIKDPKLDKAAILAQIHAQIAGKDAPDFTTIGPMQLRTAVTDPTAAQTSASNHEAFIDLMMIHQLREHEFTSEAPVVGTLLAKFRELWSWMAAKWAIRSVIQQQTAVNGQIAILLLEMETRLEEQNQELAALRAEVKQLATNRPQAESTQQ
ncbi:MAG: hypothetical protein KC445_04960 [Anaerolineales bacterium]|nr:hypothetical protein [Anaerolineales bacterium]